MFVKSFVFAVIVGLGAAASVGLLKLGDLPDNVSLLDLDIPAIDHLLKDKVDVEQFTECFIDLKSCPSKPARSLINEIRRLKFRGECPTCTPEEQKLLHGNVFHFIDQYSTMYKSQWRRVLPMLGFLLNQS